MPPSYPTATTSFIASETEYIMNWIARIDSGIGARVKLGIVLCLFIAAGFSAYVLLLYLVRGSQPFVANGTTISAVVFSYFAWAVVGGVVIGISLPLARNRWGAALVGFLGMVPFYGMITFTDAGFSITGLHDVVKVLVVSGLVGPMVGIAYYRIFGE